MNVVCTKIKRVLSVSLKFAVDILLCLYNVLMFANVHNFICFYVVWWFVAAPLLLFCSFVLFCLNRHSVLFVDDKFFLCTLSKLILYTQDTFDFYIHCCILV